MKGLGKPQRRRTTPLILGAAISCWMLWACPTPYAEEAPAVDQQSQGARERAVEALKRGDAEALFQAMDELRDLAALGATVPPGLYFAEADSARTKGDPVRAERAFNDYFKVAEPAGDTYAEAMRAYTDFRFRSGLPESAWVVLEDMVPVAAGILPAHAGQPETPVGAFSIARHPVTQGQFMAFVEATGREQTADEVPGCTAEVDVPDADRKAPRVCVSWADAIAYVTWLNANTGLELRLARAAELRHAQRRLVLRNGEAGAISEWTADCALPPDGGEPGGRPCHERVVVPDSGGTLSPSDGLTPVDGRPEAFRSNEIGFRLALGA